jgi:alpha-L-rhamnosidase
MLKTALIFSISNLYLSKVLGLGLAPEPWLPLHGGAFSNPPVPLSPDPLISYVWPLESTNDTLLQVFSIPAVSIRATPSSSFDNITSAIGSLDCSIKVQGQGQLIIDFGIEAPAWIEFDSKDLQQVDAERLVVASGEYSDVNFDGGGYKEDVPKIYGSSCGSGSSLCTYRLETNSELYEGVRFAFLTIKSTLSSPFTITALRLVSQAKPVNYVGSFHSAGDPLLEKIWYTGAYTVRATMQSDYLGSILEDRGDRQSWTVSGLILAIAMWYQIFSL